MEFTHISSFIEKYNSLAPIESKEKYELLSNSDKMFIENWLLYLSKAINSDMSNDKAKELAFMLLTKVK